MRIAIRLQERILKDIGIDVDVPVSINRGHWREDGVVRWYAIGVDGQRYEGEDSMGLCVKHGVCHPRTPAQYWHAHKCIDVNYPKVQKTC